MKKRVLFVCIHNSARSQMAEAWLNHLCPESFEAHSAGLEPGTINPLVVEAMQETGIDISGKLSRPGPPFTLRFPPQRDASATNVTMLQMPPKKFTPGV